MATIENQNLNSNYEGPIYNIPLNDVPKSAVIVHLDSAHRNSSRHRPENGYPDSKFARCFYILQYFWKYILAAIILIVIAIFCGRKLFQIVHKSQEVTENTWSRISTSYDADADTVSVDIEENFHKPSLNSLIRFKRESNLIEHKVESTSKCPKNHFVKTINRMAKRVKAIHSKLGCEDDESNSLENDNSLPANSSEMSIRQLNTTELPLAVKNSSNETFETISMESTEIPEIFNATVPSSIENSTKILSNETIESNESLIDFENALKKLTNFSVQEISTKNIKSTIIEFTTDASINIQSNEIEDEGPEKFFNFQSDFEKALNRLTTEKTFINIPMKNFTSPDIPKPEIISNGSKIMSNMTNVLENSTNIPETFMITNTEINPINVTETFTNVNEEKNSTNFPEQTIRNSSHFLETSTNINAESNLTNFSEKPSSEFVNLLETSTNTNAERNSTNITEKPINEFLNILETSTNTNAERNSTNFTEKTINEFVNILETSTNTNAERNSTNFPEKSISESINIIDTSRNTTAERNSTNLSAEAMRESVNLPETSSKTNADRNSTNLSEEEISEFVNVLETSTDTNEKNHSTNVLEKTITDARNIPESSTNSPPEIRNSTELIMNSTVLNAPQDFLTGTPSILDINLRKNTLDDSFVRNANDELNPRQFATSETVKANQELKFNYPNSLTSSNIICIPNPQQFPGGIAFPQSDPKQQFLNGDISPRFPGVTPTYNPYLNFNYYNGYMAYPNMYPNYNIPPNLYYGSTSTSNMNPQICHYVNPPNMYPNQNFFRKTEPQVKTNNTSRNNLEDNFGEQKFKDANLFLETLQCNSATERPCMDGSKCISTRQWCDDNVDCPDLSDEMNCSCKFRVDKSRLCDGFFDCPNGEDELGCFGCPDNAFSCDDWSRKRSQTKCVPVEQRCDGIQQCTVNGKDEMDCSLLAETVFQQKAFHVSLSQGFLHHNYRGIWYPVCNNDEKWANEACLGEVGAHLAPPLIKRITFKQPYKGNFIESIQQTGEMNLIDLCTSLTYVICPRIECGTRILTSKIPEDDENDILQHSVEDSLFRLKRRKRQEGERVVGGHASKPASWPWVIAIYRDGIFHCGGVIINDNWIMTAAHCTDKYWQHYYEVQAGMLRRFSYSPMEQIRSVEYVIVHRNYDRSSMKNDLALLRLQKPLVFNRWIRNICLPSAQVAGRNWIWGPPAGTVCTAVGWGATVEHGPDPDHMREVDVPILPFCKHRVDREGAELCAGMSEGGHDACQGDSGGPLLCPNPENQNQYFVAGIVSHGEGCARPNEPGVYTRVAIFIKWIQQNTLETSFPARKPLKHCPGVTCLSNGGKCLSKRRRCDGVVDCLTPEDEMNCEDHKQLSMVSRQTWESLLMAKYAGKSAAVELESNKSAPVDFSDDYVDDSFLVGLQHTVTTETVDEKQFLPDLVFPGNFGTETPAKQATIDNQNTASTIIPQKSTVSSISTTFPMEVTTTPESNQIMDDNITIPIILNPLKKSYFQCKKILQNVPIGKKCDQQIDCEDGTDEKECTCKDMLKKSHPEAICDGILDCKDGTDENSCYSCPDGYFFCERSLQCIKISLRCDGKSECLYHEDEKNCVLLTNGKSVSITIDGKPQIAKAGYITTFQNSRWQLYCNHNLNDTKATELAIEVCNNLGHPSFYGHQIRDIEATSLSINFPNGTILQNLDETPGTCRALFVRCHVGIITKLLDFYVGKMEYNLHSFLNGTLSEYAWPWNGIVYVNGIPQCTATLINVNWVITAQMCTENINLEKDYTVVVFGTGKGFLDIENPYEQLRLVNYITHLSNISLLHLEVPTNYSRFVKPLALTNKIAESLSKDVCIVVGIDKELNMLKTIFVIPITENCTASQRCFKQIQAPTDCSTYTYAWGGTVTCYSQTSGWYPSAVFYETKGPCSFTFTKSFTSIIASLNVIAEELRTKLSLISPPSCTGLRCPLGECIETNQLCDSTINCRGALDESHDKCEIRHLLCENETCDCAVDEFKCTNGQCVSKSKFCDGNFDCADKSDETETCSCRDYLAHTSPRLVCDGIRHCLDKTDELNCNCTDKAFHCTNDGPKCIPKEFVCDGEQDCADGEDEKQCIALKHHKDDGPIASGDVYIRTSGLWHAKCFPHSNITQLDIENICNQIGFINGRRSNKDLLGRDNEDPFDEERNIEEPEFDRFQAIRLNKAKILYARLGQNLRPYANLKYVKRKCNIVNVICE